MNFKHGDNLADGTVGQFINSFQNICSLNSSSICFTLKLLLKPLLISKVVCLVDGVCVCVGAV